MTKVFRRKPDKGGKKENGMAIKVLKLKNTTLTDIAKLLMNELNSPPRFECNNSEETSVNTNNLGFVAEVRGGEMGFPVCMYGVSKGGVSRVRVSFPEGICLEVRDDSKGFDYKVILRNEEDEKGWTEPLSDDLKE